MKPISRRTWLTGTLGTVAGAAAPAGVIATRFSSGLISFGTAMSMARLPMRTLRGT